MMTPNLEAANSSINFIVNDIYYSLSDSGVRNAISAEVSSKLCGLCGRSKQSHGVAKVEGVKLCS